MHGLAAGAVMNLVATAGAVGDDEIVRTGLAYRREQRQFAHGERDVDGRGAIAEGAGHAAAARLDRPDLEPGHRPQGLLDRAHRVEGLLVAMAVQMRDTPG